MGSLLSCIGFQAWISLVSVKIFSDLQYSFQEMVLFKLVVFLIFVGFIYHLLAGVKKLLSEVFGFGETLKSGNLLTWAVFGLTLVLSFLVSIKIFN